MFANFKFTSHCLVCLVLAGATAQAGAQSIEEISELQRQKVVADLKRQVQAAKGESTSEIAAPVRLAPVKPAVQAPEVLAIFGKEPKELRAMISEPTSRNLRVREGDTTPSGWSVERITRSDVTFVRTQTDGKAHKPRRMTVAWQRLGSELTPITSAPAMASPVPLPVLGLPPNAPTPTVTPVLPGGSR